MPSQRRQTKFEENLNANVTVHHPTPSGRAALVDLLATRGWFDERRRQLVSSGGRPTNPSWDLKRLIPFSTESWTLLAEIGKSRAPGLPGLGPGQVAAFIVEDALADHPIQGVLAIADSAEGERRFGDWELPELFAGRAA